MKMSEAADLLRQNDDFLLLTHIRPDGDTIGSSAALCHALRRLGKRAYLFDNEEITEKYAPFAAPYIAAPDFVPAFVVAVDIADGKLLPKTAPQKIDLCIDHHPTNTFYAANSLIGAEKAACGEIVLELIKELCGGIDAEEANLLYMAISTDTGCFVYANTTPETHEAAAETIRAGADMAALNKLLFRTFRKERLALEGLIYSNMRSYMDNRINIAVITLDMMERSGAVEDDCDDLASLPGKVAGSIINFTIRELHPNHCKISARCAAVADVSVICAKWGGGGHKMASGCEMDATPDECAELMRQAAFEVLS